MRSTILLLRSIHPGELPPPPPRACFGREELTEKIVGLVKNLTPIALIGAGGIGKTYIALTILHHDCIKERFGENRWFIRCDQVPASCTHFLSMLGSKIEGLPDDHPSKPLCLPWLAWLFGSVGNYTECKRLLVHSLKLRRERGDEFQVAETLMFISRANWLLRLHKEGIQRAEEALGIYERLDNTTGQARACLVVV